MAKRSQPRKPAGEKPIFKLGPRILREASVQPFSVHREQQEAASHGQQRILPAHRRLKVYTQDPSTSQMDVKVVEAEIPYEPLEPGPSGSVIFVDDLNIDTGLRHPPLDLNDPLSGYPAGLKPSTTDWRFAQQMTYALTMNTYESFRVALGRDPDFAFDAHDADGPPDATGNRNVRLHVYPHAHEEDNAWYDPDTGTLNFGYMFANKFAVGLNQPKGIVFTALSHDVVMHEMTHALLDGMRSHFMLPTNPDVDGFHEGFSDLVALFHRFRYRDLVKRAIKSSAGTVTSGLLVKIARQFGEATSDGRTPLRLAFQHEGGPDDPVRKEDLYKKSLEAHDMGAVLLRAVFDAFRWIFDRKTEGLRALAPPVAGRLPGEMVELLAKEAERLAEQFLNIIIRAVDYCPPVDMKLGEYLRALVTADFDLVPDDPWGYREALVQAFRRYGITVDEVPDLSEDALLWLPPEQWLAPVPGLRWDELRFDRGVWDATSIDERKRRAEALGAFVSRPAVCECFGLAPPSVKKKIEPAVVESIRVLRRVGPDGTVNIDLVGEVVQRRKVSPRRWMYGGSTVIIDSAGLVRYAIVKSVMSKTREQRIGQYLSGNPAYARHFTDNPPPAATRMRRLHDGSRGPRGRTAARRARATKNP